MSCDPKVVCGKPLKYNSSENEKKTNMFYCIWFFGREHNIVNGGVG